MQDPNRLLAGILVSWVFSVGSWTHAQEWPQWRGPNRDAKAVGFEAPATWPDQLTRQWTVSVGDGVATPALADQRLYVFTRQDGQEVLRCLDAATGQEMWRDAYDAQPVRGPAARFGGPRSSPTVAEGYVVTLGVDGTFSCLDATTGKLVWRKNDFQGTVPRFATASSPIVVDGLCVAQLGGDRNGTIAAYELGSGNLRWQWTGDAPAYGSPVLLVVDGTRAIVTPTDRSLVAVDTSGGQLLWSIPYSQGRYNAATPIVDQQRLIYAGPNRGTSAVQLAKQNAEMTAEELWENADHSLMFNTPVVKDGFLYGISTVNSLFCVNTENGQTAWDVPIDGQARDAGGRGATAGQEPGPGGQRGGRRGARSGFGAGGYGSVVDAGSVLLALTPNARLIVFQPSGQEFKQLASYQVAEGGTYAYPVVSGNRICIKDQDSITLWTIE